MKKAIILLGVFLLSFNTLAYGYVFRGIDNNWGILKETVIKFETGEKNSTLINEGSEFLVYKINSNPNFQQITYIFNEKRLKGTCYYDFLDKEKIDAKYKRMREDSLKTCGEPIRVDENQSIFLLDDNSTISVMKSNKDSNILVFLSSVNNENNNDKTINKTVNNDKNRIVIQGFYIGMPFIETVELLNGKHSDVFGSFEIETIDYDYEDFWKKLPVKPVKIKNKLALVNIANTYYDLKYEKCFIYKNTIINGKNSEFLSDEHGNLIGMFLPSDIVNKMFNVEDMRTDKFAQAFIDAYKIFQMEPMFNDDLSVYHEYTSPDGYKITIKDDKSILIKKVASTKERSFN